jgi:hypothetical protein
MTDKDVSLKLPPEPLLELVAVALGLNLFQEVTQIETLFQYQSLEGLKLYLPRGLSLRCQLASDGVDAQFDYDGEIDKVLSCGPTLDFNTTNTLVQIGRCVLTQDYQLIVSSVWVNDVEYLLTDETGSFVESLPVTLRPVFALRDELKAFHRMETADLPSYADPTSEHYAPELALAIEMHQVLRVNSPEKPSNMSQAVHRWLNKNKPELKASTALLNRLSSIINKKIP